MEYQAVGNRVGCMFSGLLVKTVLTKKVKTKYRPEGDKEKWWNLELTREGEQLKQRPQGQSSFLLKGISKESM
jgi:hypothetical protein